VTEPPFRTFTIQPNTWWGKLLALAAAILLVSLAIVFFTVFLGLLVVGVLVAPLLGWWRARQLRRGAAAFNLHFIKLYRPDVAIGGIHRSNATAVGKEIGYFTW